MPNNTYISIILISLLFLSGCVSQNNTAFSQNKSDSTLTFDINKVSIRTASNYKVFINNQDMGPMDQYITGTKGLSLRAGKHDLKIVRSGATILERSIYIARGSSEALRIQ